ncbi:hypothetical protein PGT21_010490 [Puccinia graminis f. sp. tritici]|uniref:Uncharacterized protein n=1 Tax=Puccinia graminis f. sp. tritici TaxID=56615 RepID=A0A5B0SD10_PUCGR|nr:hypothetical protein PGT21_010490 [Puccinia graminis f. sp. tritici]KAA1135956.1 hypothetical protein PGTUg99_009228 [Puccinia graminis f. sp. tritici]
MVCIVAHLLSLGSGAHLLEIGRRSLSLSLRGTQIRETASLIPDEPLQNHNRYSYSDYSAPLKKMTLLIRASEPITVGRLISSPSKLLLLTLLMLKSFCPRLMERRPVPRAF